MYAHNSNDVVKYEDDGYKMKTIDVICTNGTQKCVNGGKGTSNNTDKTQIWCVEILLLHEWSVKMEDD